MIQIVIQALATIVLLTDIALVLFFVILLLHKAKLKTPYPLLKKWAGEYGYFGAFLVALVATLGSLFYSEVAKFQPCILCWYQRIFMYPQPILLYTAILRNEKILKPYLIIINVIGAVIALYHYLMQLFPKALALQCSAVGGASCIKGYTFHYGFISIPLEAFTAFILIIVLLSYSDAKSSHTKK